MKNIIACFLILSALHSQAQQDGLEVIPKGTKFIGGALSANFNGSSTIYPDVNEEYKIKTTSFGLGPEIGKYIRDNVSIGLGVGYNFTINKYKYPDDSETESLN